MARRCFAATSVAQGIRSSDLVVRRLPGCGGAASHPRNRVEQWQRRATGPSWPPAWSGSGVSPISLQHEQPDNAKAKKSEWPELVGHTIKEAKEKIKADRPDLNVQVATVGQIFPAVIDENRVRIWVDTVAKIPRIG